MDTPVDHSSELMNACNLLSGLKIVSFCHWLQGAAATLDLSDLGADVVKIEPITGAHERHWSGGKGFVNGVSTFSSRPIEINEAWRSILKSQKD